MARPTNVEPKGGEVSRNKENNAPVQVESKQETSDLEATGKDAGESTSPTEAATSADPLHPDLEKKSTSVTTSTPEDVQEESASVTKGSKETTGETKQENAAKDGGSASDNDTGERPVREKLRETSIAGLHNAQAEPASSPDDTSMASQKSPSAVDEASDTSSVDGRARSTKKRSIDDVQPGDQDGDSNTDDETAHRRKRSRESTPGDSPDVGENHVKPDTKAMDEDDAAEKTSTEMKAKGGDTATTDDGSNADERAREKLMSPKKKRSRDQFDNDLKEELSAEKKEERKTASQDASASSEIPSDNVKKDKGEPEKKRHRDNSQERDTTAESDLATAKIPSTNAFSNSSAVSPFASLASSKSPAESEKPNRATSSSAFASSSLAAFAGSDKSPFSSLAGSTPPSSAFGSAATTDSNKTEPAGFAGAASATSGASPFASTGTSGFGKLGSGAGFAGSSFGGGFAGAAKPGGGLTSFAAPTGPGVLGSGSSKAKPFGSPADGEEEEDNEKPGFEGLEDEKEDERFFKQDTETGEEDEVTQFSCKAKLFHFDAKEWKERGLGTFKLNVTKGSAEDSKISSARLIMRADGALRVILNTPVFNGMTVGDASGKEPTSKQVHLASLENGRSVPLLLRTGSNDLAKELYNKIESLKKIL